ncbi:MAG: hypothetical protein HUJ53_10220, partial [Holdemanella sp.]|nr:hypothetical protein [Holdemanella sp.]
MNGVKIVIIKDMIGAKANANMRILQTRAENGLGADCVSGNEVTTCIKAGFPGNKIVFAGVGKTDKEI